MTEPHPLGVDDTDLECVNDLLYVEETVLDEDIECVRDAVRQFVVDPESVDECHDDTVMVEDRLTDEV